MIEFTANYLHEKRQEVYQAALKGPVKITHKFHGDFILMSEEFREDEELQAREEIMMMGDTSE